MAGDWIPVQTDLVTRREVLLIAAETGLCPDTVVMKAGLFLDGPVRKRYGQED